MPYMKRAIELAKNGAGYVSPNPLVGAVIVKDDIVIGEGWHQKYGDNHAEVNAFMDAEKKGLAVEGADMYVTLEPCSHYGHTPPCAKSIIDHKIKKVYVGLKDPNPKVAGNGINMLRNAGIEVVENYYSKECRNINQIFLKYITTGLPYVIMKYAMTLDGKISAYTGDSKWVTSENSRNNVQHLRNDLKAIMVGINTVLTDNPYLTCRIEDGVNPIRIIVDSSLRIPENANVLKISENSKCIIAVTNKADKSKIKSLTDKGVQIIICKEYNGCVDLKDLMFKLGELKIDSILLEGGGTLNFSALSQGIVDCVYSYIAPKIIGGSKALTPVEGNGISLMKDAIVLKDMEFSKIDEDLFVKGYLRRY